MSSQVPPRVFISYAREDDVTPWVEELATRLCSDGVDVVLDEWMLGPGSELPSFMETAVRESAYVLSICTPLYKKKSDGGLGGAGFEGRLLKGYLLNMGDDYRYIPVLRKGEWIEASPSWLLSKYYVDLRGNPYSEEEYQKLLNSLFGRNPLRPPVGEGATATPDSIAAVQANQDSYLQYLINLYLYVDPRGVRSSTSVRRRLDDVYVSLTAQKDMRAFDNERSYYYGSSAASSPAADTEDHEENTSYELAKIIRENPRLVILGDPGSGKSTLLFYIALLFARSWGTGSLVMDAQGNDYGYQRFPLLVRIAQYASAREKEQSLTLIDFLTQHADCGNLPRQVYATMILEVIRSGQGLIMMDGLDEVVSPGERIKIGREIERFISAYLNNRFIISSRIVGYREAPLAGDLAHFTLDRLGMAQVERFVMLWQTSQLAASLPASDHALHRSRAALRTRSILKSIRVHPSIQYLASNPLLLKLLLVLHQVKGDLPVNNRGELFASAVKVLLEDWELTHGLSTTEILSEEESVQILGPLARWLHENHPLGFAGETEIKTQLKRSLSILRGTSIDRLETLQAVSDFLFRVRERTGFFVERAPGKYGFIHLTLEEYFTARDLIAQDGSLEAALKVHLHQARWQEPLLLAFNLLSSSDPEKAASLIRDLMLHRHDDPDEAILHRSLLFCGLCLAENPGLEEWLGNDIARELVRAAMNSRTDALREKIEETIKHSESLRVRACEVLKEISDNSTDTAVLSAVLNLHSKIASLEISLADFSWSMELLSRVYGPEYLTQQNYDVKGEMEKTRAMAGLYQQISTLRTQSDADFLRYILKIIARREPEQIENLSRILIVQNEKSTDWVFELSNEDRQSLSRSLQTELFENTTFYSDETQTLLLNILIGVDSQCPELVPFMVGQIKNSQRGEKMTACLEKNLPRLAYGDKAVVDLLISAHWLDTIGLMGIASPDVIAFLYSRLLSMNDHVDPPTAMKAAKALATLGKHNKDAILTLLPALDFQHDTIVPATSEALRDSGLAIPEVMDALKKALHTPRTEFQLVYIAEAMIVLGMTDPYILEVLVHAAGGWDAPTEAQKILGEIKVDHLDGEGRQILLRALRNTKLKPDARLMAARTLSNVTMSGDLEVIDALQQVLNDPPSYDTYNLRWVIVESLGKVGAGNSDVTRLMLSILQDPQQNSDMQERAIYALRRMGASQPVVIALLIDLLNNKDEEIQASAVRTLVKIISDNPSLSEDVRSSIVQALRSKYMDVDQKGVREDVVRPMESSRPRVHIKEDLWQALWDCTSI